MAVPCYKSNSRCSFVLIFIEFPLTSQQKRTFLAHVMREVRSGNEHHLGIIGSREQLKSDITLLVFFFFFVVSLSLSFFYICDTVPVS